MQNKRTNKGKSPLIYAVLLLVLVGLIAATVFVISGLSSRAAVVREAEAHRFLTARSNMFDAMFVSNKLRSYVEAGVLYENKSYSAAEARFKELGNYRDSDYMANASHIKDVYKRSLLGSLDPDMYFELKTLSEQLTRYSELVKLCGEYMEDLKPQLYELAAAAYRDGDVDKAELYFAEFDTTYKRTLSYSVLITCQRLLKDDPDEAAVQACYDALLTCLDLEDAAQLILSNTAIAEKFLEGTWRSSDKNYRFILYREYPEPEESEELNEITNPVIIDPDAATPTPVPVETEAEESTEEAEEPEFVFKVDHNMPNFGIREVMFEINNCVYSSSNGSNGYRDVFRIGIIDRNTVVFYCFYNGNRITLIRSS